MLLLAMLSHGLVKLLNLSHPTKQIGSRWGRSCQHIRHMEALRGFGMVRSTVHAQYPLMKACVSSVSSLQDRSSGPRTLDMSCAACAFPAADKSHMPALQYASFPPGQAGQSMPTTHLQGQG